jgi:hypothetical protein
MKKTIKTNVKAGVIRTVFGNAAIRTPWFTLAGDE